MVHFQLLPRQALLGLMLTACFLTGVNAQQASADSRYSLSKFSVDAKVGTQGFGGSLSYAFTPTWAVRGEFNTLSIDRNVSTTNLDYLANIDLQTTGLLAEWHPFQGGFFLSGGGYYNRNRLNLLARPRQSTINLDGVSYSTDQIGTVTGKLDYPSFAPYLGMGYRLKMGMVQLNTEAGVMFSGNARASLTVNCGPLLTDPSLQPVCAAAQQDANQEVERARDKFDVLKYYPVLSIGMGLNF